MLDIKSKDKNSIVKKIKNDPNSKILNSVTAVQDSSNFQMPSCNSKALLFVFGRT